LFRIDRNISVYHLKTIRERRHTEMKGDRKKTMNEIIRIKALCRKSSLFTTQPS